MGQPKKICLITPGHIASNPRLVKEADALGGSGYAVHIVFTQYLSYLQKEDYAILKAHPAWTFSVLDWTGNNFRSRYRQIFFGAIQKTSSKLGRFLPFHGFRLLAINRFFFGS